MGNVRSLKRPVRTTLGIAMKGGKLLKKIVASTGYQVVNLSSVSIGKKQELVHRLVLLSFVGPCPSGMECAHNNGNRQDARLENLRWSTRKSNHADKHDHGTAQRGERHGNAKLLDIEVVAMRNMKLSAKQISDQFGVSKSCAKKIISGESWRHLL